MGVVLYETTDGACSRFAASDDPQIMQAVLRGTYDPPVTLVKTVPPELAAIIDRALAPEPRMRFATAERMRVALEEWLAKSGSVVTSTQMGSLVRQRLGASLDRRREHVKAAMAALQPDAPTTPQLGHTPPKPQAGQSHSGVVATGAGQPAMPTSDPMRARAPSLPGGVTRSEGSPAHGRAAAAATSAGAYGAAAHRVAAADGCALRRGRDRGHPVRSGRRRDRAGHLDVDALAPARRRR